MFGETSLNFSYVDVGFILDLFSLGNQELTATLENDCFLMLLSRVRIDLHEVLDMST